MSLSTKSALSYFGSDSEVASQLASMLDACSHVTVPFVGGAAILPYIKAKALVCNDLNSLAINFYRVASGVYGGTARHLLFERADATLSHPSELAWASAVLGIYAASGSHALDDTSKSELAWAYWALCWIGRKGKGGTTKLGGCPSIRRSADGGNNASRIRSVARDMQIWAEHFRRCEWESRDFREVIAKCLDRDSCGLYCDPPWVGAGDAYLHSFSEQDHKDLADALGRFSKTTVVLRYGDHPLVHELYRNWNILEASSRTQANKELKELWITNKELPL